MKWGANQWKQTQQKEVDKGEENDQGRQQYQVVTVVFITAFDWSLVLRVHELTDTCTGYYCADDWLLAPDLHLLLNWFLWIDWHMLLRLVTTGDLRNGWFNLENLMVLRPLGHTLAHVIQLTINQVLGSPFLRLTWFCSLTILS